MEHTNLHTRTITDAAITQCECLITKKLYPLCVFPSGKCFWIYSVIELTGLIHWFRFVYTCVWSSVSRARVRFLLGSSNPEIHGTHCLFHPWISSAALGPHVSRLFKAAARLGSGRVEQLRVCSPSRRSWYEKSSEGPTPGGESM